MENWLCSKHWHADTDVSVVTREGLGQNFSSNRALRLVLPLVLFHAAWWVTLGCYSIGLADFMSGQLGILASIYVVSSIGFGAGFAWGLALRRRLGSRTALEPDGGRFKIRVVVLCLAIGAAAIVIANAWMHGPPPIFRSWGFETEVYTEYGRWKGVLFPVAMLLVLAAAFEVDTRASMCAAGLGAVVLLLYVARGPLSLAVIEYGLGRMLFSTGRRARYVETLIALLIAAGLFGWLGETRSGRGYFASAMQIRNEYQGWPSGLLWLLGYVSFPAENLVALVSEWREYEYGRRMMLGLLPAFLGSVDRADERYLGVLPNPLNNVPTYLGWSWMDFGWLGVIFLNVIWGAVGGLLVERPLGRGGLVSLVYYGAVMTLFFNDRLLWFPGFVQIGLAYVIERWVWGGRVIEPRSWMAGR